VLDPDDIATLVRNAYGLEVSGAELIRSLVNDVYAVTSCGQRYALKLYRRTQDPGATDLDEVCWEQDLAARLAAAGVTTAAPVACRDGQLAGVVAAPEGPRPYALTKWARGRKPQPPVDDDLYRAFGRTLARFHRVAAGVVSDHHRRPFDVSADLDARLPDVLARLSADDRAVVGALAEAARAGLAAAAPALTSGVRHGDVTLDNVHRDGAVVHLHDFDLAGPGWLAADFTGVHATGHWQAFLDGYTGHSANTGRPSPADLAALPWLRIVALIANLRFHLVDKVALRGSESVHEGWVDRELTSLRELAHTLVQ
jgi:Ser/Thr protein kinase RdoA (MazF antagonist)